MFPKFIALYLPQFHEFVENNKFWGEGFTEWTHIKKALPQYKGHRILKPHPDIGYYCLDDIKIRKQQAILAKKFGIYGFCYYHYWFHGKVLMQRPLEKMLIDGEPDLPFCLSWANEPWRKSMNGGNNEIIVDQHYGKETEWESHFQYLNKFFSHNNYIKINNKPVLVVYRVSQIDDFEKRFDYWREKAIHYGYDGIFIISTLGNFQGDPHLKIATFVDGTMEFFPNFLGNKSLMKHQQGNRFIYDKNKVWDFVASYPKLHEHQFRGVLSGFDNSARNTLRCNIIDDTDPIWFKSLLIEKIKQSTEDFLFINAWNEWSEGAVLEPEELNEYNYLRIIKDVQTKIV